MTYEYVCTACGHQWEAEQPISAEALKKCPECKRNRAKRQISGGLGFILKGSGWYADGYGLGRKQKESRAAAGSEQPDSDSKPAAESADSQVAADAGDAKSKSEPSKAKPAAKGGGSSSAAA